MKIYVAGSWKHTRRVQMVVALLREVGHEVYDFTRPPSNSAFKWEEIDPDYEDWTDEQYLAALEHPLAQKGFESDYNAILSADACVLVLPCNRSAHLEAGFFLGAGKPLVIMLHGEDARAELMYKMTDWIFTGIQELVKWAIYRL